MLPYTRPTWLTASWLGSQFDHLGDAAWAMMTYQVGVIIGQSIVSIPQPMKARRATNHVYSPQYSRLSDQYGRKQIMLIAHVLFIVGTVCAWLATLGPCLPIFGSAHTLTPS